MTDPEIEEAYQKVEDLTVKLAHDASYGPVYLQEKLLEARAKQEDVADLVVKVNKSLSAVLQEKIAQEAIVRISTSDKVDQERAALVDILGRYGRLKYLLEAVNVRRKNLLRVTQDVRLLLECLKVGLSAAGAKLYVPVPESQTIRTTTVPNVDQATASKLQEFYDAPGSQPPAAEGTASGGDWLDDLIGVSDADAVEAEK